MSHVFLRCTFGILLLFVVLEPEATSTCNDKENIFKNMISKDINQLKHKIDEYAPGCNQSNISVFCNRNKVIEVMYNMTCQLERISKICNITEDLKSNMNVAQLIRTELQNCTIHRREPKKQCQGTGGRKRLCPICRIKEAVSKLKSCWPLFIRHWPP